MRVEGENQSKISDLKSTHEAQVNKMEITNHHLETNLKKLEAELQTSTTDLEESNLKLKETQIKFENSQIEIEATKIEVDLLRRLNHPNTVRMYDYGELDNMRVYA